MTDLTETLKRIRELAGKVTPDWPGPWECMNEGMSVWGRNLKIGGGQKLLDIRGWGYLTGHGHGGLGLSETEAVNKQVALAEYIAAVDPTAVSAILDELERVTGELRKHEGWGCLEDGCKDPRAQASVFCQKHTEDWAEP